MLPEFDTAKIRVQIGGVVVQRSDCHVSAVYDGINSYNCRHQLPLAGATVLGYALDTLTGQMQLIGVATTDSEGHYVLNMVHDSGAPPPASETRWELELRVIYNGVTFTPDNLPPHMRLYSMGYFTAETNTFRLDYTILDENRPLLVPLPMNYAWHRLVERLAEDCDLRLDELELDIDVDRPFEELSNEERRTIAAAVFRRRITGPEDVDWFTAQLVEVLTPGKTPEEVEQDRLAEQSLRHALDCCDDCDISIPVELPPWDITVPKLPDSVSQLLGTDALSGFQQGRPLSGRVYLP